MLKMCTSYLDQIVFTRLETRGPRGLTMVYFKCFHVTTFVLVDIFPWIFNTIIHATEQSLGYEVGFLSLLVWKLEAQNSSLKMLRIEIFKLFFSIINQKVNITLVL